MKIGVYAGSFDPFHLGHADVYRQAKQQFDMVILAVGRNPGKNQSSRNIPIVMGIDCIRVFRGLLSDELKSIAKEYNADVSLVRGLRNIYDLGAEQNMLAFIKSMYPELKVVYFLCDPKYQHISSRALKEIKEFSEEEYQKYLVK